jgi:hypothetical protein
MNEKQGIQEPESRIQNEKQMGFSAGFWGPRSSFIVHRSSFILISACAFALYAWTAAPTLTWGGGDSAKLALWVHRGEIGHAAESHPLYVLLGRAFAALPLGGDLAHRLNLFSALCAALAVGAMFLLCGEAGKSVFGAACASVALALSHTFWLHAVLTEVYALHLLLLLSALACLLRWDRTGRHRYLYLSALLFGAGLANHILTAWALPGVAYFVLSGCRGFSPHPGSRCSPPLSHLWERGSRAERGGVRADPRPPTPLLAFTRASASTAGACSG